MKMQIHANIKPEQGLFLITLLKEALHVLEMPLLQLASWVDMQIEQNPALSYVEEEFFTEDSFFAADFHHLDNLDPTFEEAVFPEFIPSYGADQQLVDLISTPTLREELLAQAREQCTSVGQYQGLEYLIDQLDEKGFLDPSYEGHPQLKILQSFDPPGIGALNLQNALLIQLRRAGKLHSIAFKMVHDHYQELLHADLTLISQKLGCTKRQLQTVIQQDLAPLSLNPAAFFDRALIPVQVADISAYEEEGIWYTELNDKSFFSFEVRNEIVFEKTQLKKSALWMEEMISRRGKILLAVTQWIIRQQKSFFEGKTSLLRPLNLQQAAHALSLHVSTISRAVKNKYLSLPFGVFPLKIFFGKAQKKASCIEAPVKIRKRKKSLRIEKRCGIRKKSLLGKEGFGK